MVPRSTANGDGREGAQVSLPQEAGLTNAIFGSAPRRRAPSIPMSPGHETPPTSLPKSSTWKTQKIPPVTPPRRPTRTNTMQRRPSSPDLAAMLAKTPRPRRRSSASYSPASRLLSRSQSVNGLPSSWKGSKNDLHDDAPVGTDCDGPLDRAISTLQRVDSDDDATLEKELEGDGSESDSSIDLHTPLPHLMFRDGLLSPRSKLLPQAVTPDMFDDLDIAIDGNRSQSVLSVASTIGTTKTKSGFFKDPRDTQRRRVRHRDGRLLRAGMGLTTGLGWSDSEDEDAPSTLTRRLIHTSIAKAPPHSPISSRPTSQLTTAALMSHSRSSPIQRSFLRKGPLERSTSMSFSWIRPDPSDSIEEEMPSRGRAQSTTSGSSAVAPAAIQMPATSPPKLSLLTRSRTVSDASASSASVYSTSSALPAAAIKQPAVNLVHLPSNLRHNAGVDGAQLSYRSRTSSNTSGSSVSATSLASSAVATDNIASSKVGTRRRTHSSASASTTSLASTISGGSSTASASPTPISRRPHPLPKFPARSPTARHRTMSLASGSTTSVISASTTSLVSSGSTGSTHSASSSISVPRPLHLPRTAGLHSHVPSISTPKPPAPPAADGPPESSRPRARTLSSSESASVLSKVAAPSPVAVKPASTLALARGASAALRSHRARPSLGGPRPKPRTGTGMAYRTSVYSSLHATVLSMRTVAAISPSADSGVMI